MDAMFIYLAVFLIGSLLSRGFADPVEDKQALLDFVHKFSHSRTLNWNENSAVCNNWTGVTCNIDNSRVVAIRLPGVGFKGPIPPNTLSRLSQLQILSLRSNSITGPFPSDFSNLKKLSFLYLQFNRLSGPLPSNFSVWKNLTIINLSHNAFNGSIPLSISNLTQLTSLNLASNLLSGEIPNVNPPNLQQLYLADNHLNGSIPESLRKFPISAFSGNNISFISSLISPVNPPAVPPRVHSRKTKKLGELLGIIIGACIFGIGAFAFLLVVCYSKTRRGNDGPSSKVLKGDRSPDKVIQGGQDGNSRLVFIEGCSYVFDLEDLLTASAEVLGKGTFGTAYKAALEDATTVVVKRLKEVNVGKREFDQQMEMVGKIKHENVAELRAYYYSKDEKLMVYDYYSQGSLSSLLHGKRGEGRRIPLDWDTRLRIAVGAARGIACIHTDSSGKLIHGNIKSSNIFLNSQNYGCVSDLGLSTLTIPTSPPITRSRITGYRAPEVTDTRKAAQPSDVYSFGVVLLEILTGKSPVPAVGGEEAVPLVRWVQSVVREEWTAEVFDVELMRYPNIEEEMVQMLQIAMSCVVRMPDQRPKMTDVVKMVEDIRRIDTGTRPSSDTRSEPSTPPAPDSSSMPY